MYKCGDPRRGSGKGLIANELAAKVSNVMYSIETLLCTEVIAKCGDIKMCTNRGFIANELALKLYYVSVAIQLFE